MILHNSIRVAQDLHAETIGTQANCVRLTFGHRNHIAKRYAVNQPSFRGEVHLLRESLRSAQNLQVTKRHPQNRPEIIGSVHSITGSNPVQPFGSSLASLRWRRLISPRKAATINCPVLSPSSFTFSISSITSWGTREAICVDLLLLRPVAMTIPRCIRWLALYTKKIGKKGLRWLAPLGKVVSTLVVLKLKNSEARQCGNTNRASNHKPLSEVTIMAELQHTQTQPKFTWRFLALSSIGCNVVHIPANTEREAREQSPAGCVMVFAGRLPVQEVRHA